MSKNDNEGEQIIPSESISDYLEQTLPTWIGYSKKQKDDIYVITDYLNQTKHDFMEDRLLRTAQAWECASSCWTNEMELPPLLIELKERLKKTIKDWKTETKYIDKDGELGTRILSSLEQEKLLIKLDKLIVESKLKKEAIGLDLKRLKDLRDLVAHTGRINISGTDAVDFLQTGVTGLQLILLKRLGYAGSVIIVKRYDKTTLPIDELFA